MKFSQKLQRGRIVRTVTSNIDYIQRSILNEIHKEYTTRDIADATLKHLTKMTGATLTVYDTHDFNITFRKAKECNVPDESIIKSLHQGIQDLIDDFEDFEDILLDHYDFKYSKKFITDLFIESIIEIRRSGKLIHIDLDI